MLIKEFVTEAELSVLDERASKRLCLSTTPDSDLGASNLSSCKSQGYRARSSRQSFKIGNKRVKTDGKKIKGEKYGGPIPDYSGH